MPLENFKNPWGANFSSDALSSSVDASEFTNEVLDTPVFDNDGEVLGVKGDKENTIPFEVKIKCKDPLHNNTYIKDGEVVFISSEPQMPEITIEINMGYKTPTYEFAYKHIYAKVVVKYEVNSGGKHRNDLFRIPMDKDYFLDFYFEEQEMNNTVTLDKLFMLQVQKNVINKLKAKVSKKINWYNQYLGGEVKVYFYADLNEKSKLSEFTFHIRGKNPTKQQVRQYLQQQGYLNRFWFIYKMLVSESNSAEKTIMQQFNEAGTPSATDQNAGLPNWGTPRGWGMAQLDFSANDGARDRTLLRDAPTKTLWNWKENIDLLITRLSVEKVADMRDSVTKGDADFTGLVGKVNKFQKDNPNINVSTHETENQTEENITFINCESQITELQQFNIYMNSANNNLRSDTVKSFLDADLIKRYNSGRYLFKLFKNDNNLPEWELKRVNGSNFNYVSRVCSINE